MPTVLGMGSPDSRVGYLGFCFTRMGNQEWGRKGCSFKFSSSISGECPAWQTPIQGLHMPQGNKKKGTWQLGPLLKIYNSRWKSARERAADKYEQEMRDNAPWGFRNLRVHDLRHTHGRRLRAAGVNKETRSALLGHKTDDITTHYSQAELQELIDAVAKITDQGSRKSHALILLRAVSGQ